MKSLFIHILSVVFIFNFLALHGMDQLPKSHRYNLRSKSCTKVNKLQCPIGKCKCLFDDLKDLTEHLLVQHIACITCYEQGTIDCVFDTRRSLIQHCKESDHKIFYCSNCFETNTGKDCFLFITWNEDSLENHNLTCRRKSNDVRNCEGKKPKETFPCFTPGCDREGNPYKNLNDLYTHLATTHTICPFCPNFPTFESRGQLVSHAIKEKHPHFYCRYCHDRLVVGTARRKELDRHEERCRVKKESYDNEILDFLFSAEEPPVMQGFDVNVFDFLLSK